MINIKEDYLQWFAAGSGINSISNEQLANALHISIIRKCKSERVYSLFKVNIWGSDLPDIQLISIYNKGIRYLL